MLTDQSGGPTSPRKLEHVTLPSYSADFRINGRDIPWVARLLRPFARFVFAWFAWRAKRRSRSGSGTT